MQLNTHLHIQLTSRMCGALPHTSSWCSAQQKKKKTLYHLRDYLIYDEKVNVYTKLEKMK
jgi:hypothetical protein